MANVNRVKYGIYPGGMGSELSLPCNNSTAAISQGDLVYFDSSAHIIKPVDSDAHAATLAGIALQPSSVSSSLDNSSAPAEKTVRVGWAYVASMKTTAADTYNEGDSVYIGADAQTVTSTVGMATSPVGKVHLAPGVSSVTGATGVLVDVLIYSRSPWKSGV